MPEIRDLRLKRHHLIQIAKRQKHIQLTLPGVIHDLRHDHRVIRPETLHLSGVESFDHIRNSMRIASPLESVLHLRK
jgi:hypothetical protein